MSLFFPFAYEYPKYPEFQVLLSFCNWVFLASLSNIGWPSVCVLFLDSHFCSICLCVCFTPVVYNFYYYSFILCSIWSFFKMCKFLIYLFTFISQFIFIICTLFLRSTSKIAYLLPMNGYNASNILHASHPAKCFTHIYLWNPRNSSMYMKLFHCYFTGNDTKVQKA